MSRTIWEDVASYCNHLAPVLSPLASTLGRAAEAMDAAERETRGLQARLHAGALESAAIPEYSDEEVGLC